MILWDDATNLGYTEVCIHVKTRNNTISDHATGWRQNVFMLISIQQFFLSPCNTSHVHNRINSIKKANSFQVTLHYDFFDIYNKSKKNSLYATWQSAVYWINVLMTYYTLLVEMEKEIHIHKTKEQIIL